VKTNIPGQEDLKLSVADIRSRHPQDFPSTALILGSGLGGVAEAMEVDTAIDYGDINGFPVSTVSGHSGRLLIGRIDSMPLACMQGRMHLYEGYPPQSLAHPIRTLARLGVDTLILTNAAGSTLEDLPAGTLMMLEDHINFTGCNPLLGPNDETLGPRFVDMSEPYDAGLRHQLSTAAEKERIALESGVYVQVLGPNFETPAEVRMLSRLGADAIGMSTVSECLVARHAGLRVAAVSLITNLGSGLADKPLSHDETIHEAEKAYDKMTRLLTRFIRDLH